MTDRRLAPHLASMGALLLAGCMHAPPPPAVQAAPACPRPAPCATAGGPLTPADDAARRLLAYHEQLRPLANAELATELARQNAALAASGNAPAVALELALALAQTRNGADTQRALGLVEPIARNPTPEQQPWQALARLLHARIAEQRRLEELLERQGAQLRESQRNVQQLNEKLEALKAIERSLNNRAPAPAAPGASAPRP
ncbi:hypothetical protein [Piscinibacter sp.]|uniref:hypothetical protein n=1 Tax=Piscinibacter sp. TaxID=1903157 RepID=UPI0039E65431